MAKTTSTATGVLKGNSLLSKLLAFFGISALLGALGAGMMLPAGMLTGAASQVGTEMLDKLPAELNEEPLSTPSKILDQDGNEIATFYAENRTPVELEDISQHMQNAIIAIEDERFYSHSGVDGQGLARAMVHNVTSDTTQGASTLTQQYVNNVLVNYQNLNGLRTTVSGTKTIPDKLREMKIAVAIEKEMTKDEILEGYLNIVLFTGRTYGVEAAAGYFFNKTAAELDIGESATLAGLVQSPNALNPEHNPDGATNRRNLVLYNMHDQGYITEQEYNDAVESEIQLDITPEPTGCLNAEDGFEYFCDYVQQQILADPAFGPDRESRQRILDRGGLEITTTLDSELQRAAVDAAKDHVPAAENEGIGASIVTVQQNTGNIKAMAQNTDYAVTDVERGDSAINFGVNSAWGGGQGFQAGSTLKPFVSMAWMAEGKSMRDTIDASRGSYSSDATFPAYCLEDGHATLGSDWGVANALDNMFKPMRMDYGLYWSINSATVAAAYETDLCSITDIITAAGITTAGNEPINPANPSFVLGSPTISPLTMASGYSTLASGGTHCEPRVFTSIVDAEGEEYSVPPVQCDPGALNPENIRELNNTLTAIADERIAEGEIDFPIAGKTGTNNASSSLWFVGYTSELTTASWAGRYTSPEDTLAGTTINGRYYEDVWGARIAGPMWVDYMQEVGPLYETAEFPTFDGPTGDPAAEGLDSGSSNDDDEDDDSSNDSNSEDTSNDSEDTESNDDESSSNESDTNADSNNSDSSGDDD